MNVFEYPSVFYFILFLIYNNLIIKVWRQKRLKWKYHKIQKNDK
jgi:hypothetical protein